MTQERSTEKGSEQFQQEWRRTAMSGPLATEDHTQPALKSKLGYLSKI